MLDGKTYSLDINNDVDSLHGGFEGFNKRMWDATPIPAIGNTVGLKLYRVEPGRRGLHADPEPTPARGLPRRPST